MLAAFPEKLKENQRVADNLAYLGEWAKTPEASIVKLPNISAPVSIGCVSKLTTKLIGQLLTPFLKLHKKSHAVVFVLDCMTVEPVGRLHQRIEVQGI